MKTVVTFGELMLRLAPNGYTRLSQADTLNATFGGGEANVAVSLAGFGQAARFVSVLPNNDIGIRARNTLRGLGVDTACLSLADKGRMGIYFLEKGASQRASKVIYDRAFSAISLATSDTFHWETILKDCAFFHVSGITPALSGELATATLKAVQTAKKMGVKVSCDLNYRKKLWSKSQAKTTMETLMPYVDVLIANEEDLADVFDIHAKNSSVTGGALSIAGYQEVAQLASERYGIPTVAITLRESISASVNRWRALLYHGKQFHLSKEYEMQIVDRVGGGDSFVAGLLYGLIQNQPPQAALEFAVAASCLKHSIEGDFNCVTKEEVLQLVGGDGSGRVQR